MLLIALPFGLDLFTFEMPRMIEWHQASVHFPIGLLLTSVFCEAVGALWKRAEGFRTTAFWTQMLGTIAAAFSTALGWFGNPTRGKHSEYAQMVTVHQWWGVASLAVFVILAVWRLTRQKKRERFETAAYALITLIGIGVISLTGYLGGQLGG